MQDDTSSGDILGEGKQFLSLPEKDLLSVPKFPIDGRRGHISATRKTKSSALTGSEGRRIFCSRVTARADSGQSSS